MKNYPTLLIVLLLSANLLSAQSLILTANISDYGGYEVSALGASDGYIELSVTGGTPPYSYSWDNGESTQNIYNLSEGHYHVDVTDDMGEMAEAVYVLNEPPSAPSLSININVSMHPDCDGSDTGELEAEAFDGVPPYTYLWSNGSTDAMISGLAAGPYDLTVTDSDGGSESMSVQLEPEELEVEVDPELYPNGEFFSCETCNDGILYLTFLSGTAPYTVNWNNGSTGETLYNVQQDVYIEFTATDANGCSVTDGGTLSWGMNGGGNDPLDVMDNISYYPNGYNISSYGANDGYIELTVTGGTPPYTFTWMHGPTDQNIYGLSEGSYEVGITDDDGSYTNRSYYISGPPSGGGSLNVSANLSDYNGYQVSSMGAMDGYIELMVSGGTPPYTFNWSHGPTDQNIYGLGEGMYTVDVSDDMGETVTETYYFYADPGSGNNLDVNGNISWYPNGYNTTAPGASDGYIELSVSGGTPPYSYFWDHGATDQNIYNLLQGSYGVTVYDSNGESNYQNYYLSDPPYGGGISVHINTYFNSCDGSGNLDAYVDGGNYPLNFEWSGPEGPINENSSYINITQGGIYTVTVTDVDNNTAEASTEVIDNGQMTVQLHSPLVDGTYNTTCAGDDGTLEITITGGLPPYDINIYGDEGYQNSFNTGDLFTEIIGLEESDMFVEVRDMSGCYASEDIELTGPGNLKVDVMPTELVDGNYFSCPTCNDGEASGLALSGTAPYNYTWFTFDPNTFFTVNFKGASVFSSEPFMFEDEGENINPLPVGSGQTVSNLAAETFYGLHVVDATGCEGYRIFTLEKPKESNHWTLEGNVADETSFIGTTNEVDLQVKANNNLAMTVKTDGGVAIGTTEVPVGYKFAVNGKAIAEEVEVRLNGDWPDYVFDESYQLISLDEVKKHIDEKHHLPGMPSAAEIKKEGISLGEMDGLLLKKIEELTLYMIELKKENEELRNQVEELKK